MIPPNPSGPAYYNEIDPKAAATLRELIRAGHIAGGDVDERSIEDVSPTELTGYAQRHFFAGFGIWSLALRRAGWPDEEPVVTGSCPCQPFSSAGKGGGLADERHLWPALLWHILLGAPSAVFGEQVASKDGLAWLDIVSADLEAANYSIAAVDLCAAGFGAPHIRQRLYWMADPHGRRRERIEDGRTGELADAQRRGFSGRVERGLGSSGEEVRKPKDGEDTANELSDGRSTALRLDSSNRTGLQGHAGDGNGERGREESARPTSEASSHGILGESRGASPGPTNGAWRAADWLFCRDGRWRPVESGTFPLAHGSPVRMGRLRGYGNAIVAPVAQGYLEAAIEVLDEGGYPWRMSSY